MGTFFEKVASVDPVAQALHLPGSTSYENSQMQQQQQAAEANGLGPYARVAPSLAGANAGYVQGGPGATPGWQPYQYQSQGGLLGKLQGIANTGQIVPNGTSSNTFGANAAPTAGAMNAQNGQYVQAAAQAAQPQQQQLRPQVSALQRGATGWGG
jgi:hypothetical protein